MAAQEQEQGPGGARYSWGADEHLFVEVSEEMSLEAYFKATAMVTALREQALEGVLDVCPANASYQVRFDPDRLAPRTLEGHLREIEREVGDARDFALHTRIVEIPSSTTTRGPARRSCASATATRTPTGPTWTTARA
jgi:urea carboxylase